MHHFPADLAIIGHRPTITALRVPKDIVRRLPQRHDSVDHSKNIALQAISRSNCTFDQSRAIGPASKIGLSARLLAAGRTISGQTSRSLGHRPVGHRPAGVAKGMVERTTPKGMAAPVTPNADGGTNPGVRR
jgi:hypothetical protein